MVKVHEVISSLRYLVCVCVWASANVRDDGNGKSQVEGMQWPREHVCWNVQGSYIVCKHIFARVHSMCLVLCGCAYMFVGCDRGTRRMTVCVCVLGRVSAECKHPEHLLFRIFPELTMFRCPRCVCVFVQHKQMPRHCVRVCRSTMFSRLIQ